jgi:hypothetical protein
MTPERAPDQSCPDIAVRPIVDPAFRFGHPDERRVILDPKGQPC